jgi:GNAT superfamily N-acetyltransferase
MDRTGSEVGAVPVRRRIVEVWRQAGLRGIARRLARRLIGPVVWLERVAFYDSNLDQHDTQPLAAATVSLECRLATAHDLFVRHREAFATGFELHRADIEQRLAHGHLAIIALHDDELIGMVWLAFDAQRVSEVGKQMVLRPGEFLTYNEGTLPAWRGRGVSPHLNRYAERRRLTWRRLANRSGVQVATKLRDRRFATVTTVRLMGREQALVLGLGSAELAALMR